MPHGTPDWGHTGPKETTFGLDDLGEHAVRLGSPVAWDRRGDVIWATIFAEGPSEVYLHPKDAASNVALWAGETRQGAFCILLQPGPLATDWAAVEKYLPLPVISGWGFEFSFSSFETVASVQGEINAWDAGAEFNAGIRVDLVNDDLLYLDNTGTYVWFANTQPFSPIYNVYHVLKFVIDHLSQTYVRVIYNGHVYPLPGIAYDHVGGGAAELLHTRVRAYQGVREAYHCFVDSLIVTQNEP